MKRIKTILCSSFLVLSGVILFTAYTYARGELSFRTYLLPLRKIKVSITPPDNVYFKEGQTATFNIMITMTGKTIWSTIWEKFFPVIFGNQLQIVATFPDQETEVTLAYVSSGRDTQYYTYTTSPFRESGTPTLSVTASSKGAITGSASCTINVDAVAPVIRDLSPSEDETRTERYPIISCTYSDDLSGVDVSSVRLRADGQDVTRFSTITETNITYTPLIDYPLSYDLHQVEVEVADSAGNSTRSSWSFETTERSINNPTIDSDTIDVGYPTLVTITAEIYPDKDLSEVKLLQIGEDGQVIDTLGFLSDDGQNGDVQAGDNIYTIQETFTALDLEVIILDIVGFYTADDPEEISSMYLYLAVVLYPELEELELNDSLRLMTFNTQLKVTAWETGSDDVEVYYGMLNETRAGLIADQILAMGKKPHIIVFQEVFDEDARDALYYKLRDDYPHMVLKLDKYDLDEDSGLMLFSKLPFAPLPNTQYLANDVIAYTQHMGLWLDWSDVAFIEYDDCDSYPDSMANKGVGLVRLWLAPPPNSKFINIAFTHTQASYDDDDTVEAWERVENREGQLARIEYIIRGSLNDNSLTNELVFVMGDLNINGNPKSMANKWTGSKDAWDDYISIHGYDAVCHWYEWDYHFNRDLENCYFSTYFSDSWIYDTVESDVGQTIEGGFPFYYSDDPTQGERLDYILHNNNEVMASAIDLWPGISKYVVQHIYRVWEPVVGPEQKYSDHLAVMADINLSAPNCNPLIAYDVELNSDTQDAEIQNTIAYKGSMQWYRVGKQGGSYSIDTSPEVKFDVYEATDLSRLIKVTGEETRWGMQYSMPEAPFYIRVFSAEPSWTGNYTINIHFHLGKTKEDAILLDPLGFYKPNLYGYGHPYRMPTAGLLDPVWFKIIPEWSYTGRSPSIETSVDTIDNPFTSFYLDLMTDNDEVIAESELIYPPYEYEDPQTEEIVYRHQLQLSSLPEEGRYYLRVHTSDPQWSQGTVFIIHWQTNLTHFVSGMLRCYEQDDGTGDDDIYVDVDVDGETILFFKYLGEFDDGSDDCEKYGTESLFSFMEDYGYVDKISILLYDDIDYFGVRDIVTLSMNGEYGFDVTGGTEWVGGDPGDPCHPSWDYRLERIEKYHQMKK